MGDLEPIGYGTMGIGGKYVKLQEDKEKYSRIFEILSKQDRRVLIDTAEIYGEGFCEEIIGKLINNYGVNNFFICTKFSPKRIYKNEIKEALHGSLRRLNIDQIDMFQSHWPIEEKLEIEMIRAFSELSSSGVVKNFGLSNVTTSQLKRIEQIADQYKLQLKSIQVEMSIFDPYAMHNVIPYAKEKGYLVLSYSPLGKGQLKINLSELKRNQVESLKLKFNTTESGLWLAWIINTTGSMPIPMTTNLEHLCVNLNSKNILLSKDEIDLLTELYSPKLADIKINQVIPGTSHHGGVIKNIYEAKENTLKLSPSPEKLSKNYLRGDEMLKPIKVKYCPLKERFEIIEGQLRYWAWRIAFGEDSTVPAYIYD